MIKPELLAELENKKILLAVSGGVDSVVMLHYLVSLKDKLNLKLYIAHIDHKLRSTSAADAAFVKAEADKLNIPFHLESVDVLAHKEHGKLSLEMAAHKCRKAALLNIAKQCQSDLICTAHHENDQIESIFMRLGFGTGRQGINGLALKNGHFFKPLLRTSKSDILLYQKKHKLKFIEDESNTDTSIPRNFWRKEIIPRIKERFTNGYFKGMLASVENLNWRKEDLELLDSELAKLDLSTNLLSLEISRLKLYFSEFLKRFLEVLIKRKFDLEIKFNRDEFKQVLSLINQGESGKHLRFQSDLIITRNQKSLSIEQKPKENSVIQFTELLSEHRFKDFTLSFEELDSADFNSDKTVEYIDAEKLKSPFILRKVENGDSFYPIGLKHKQSVNRFLKSNKVEHAARKYEHLLLANDQVVWLIGRRLDERFCVDKNTKRIVRMKVIYD